MTIIVQFPINSMIEKAYFISSVIKFGENFHLRNRIVILT